jgi:glycerophosphoryl diester phosphodiesterase
MASAGPRARRPHPARSLGRPQVFAHRGGAALRPENTLLAFDHGLALGADGIELDVRLSRDNVVVVHHDATLDRTTNGAGTVASFNADELEQLDAGYNFGGPGYAYRGKAGGIPRLETVLRRYPGAWLIVELKLNDPELAHRTIDLVREAGALDRVALGSFGTRVLHAARAYDPPILTGASREETRLALYRSWVKWPVRHPKYNAFQVPEVAGSTRVISPRFVRYAHDAGVAVQVWTVNEAADMRRLLGWGVDGIISDRPDIAVEVVGGHAVRHDT